MNGFVIRGTHRAYMGADTVIAVFVRDDAGRKDLSEAEITARIQAGRGRNLVTLPVTGDSEGKISFTLDAGTTNQRLVPGSYDLRVEAGGQVIYTGTLELV